MSPVTVTGATVTGSSRLGGPGFMLNVNAGSKVAPQGVSPFAVYNGIGQMIDACMFNGQFHVVHAEIDKNMATPWGFYNYRGPYVHAWNGASWSLLGGAIDTATNSAPASNGDRWGAREPRIATDGTDLFVAYFDEVVLDIGSGSSFEWLRIAKWNGASWTELASHQCSGAMSITAKNGLAYCVVAAAIPNAGLGGTQIATLVVRSDGTFGFVPYSASSGTGSFSVPPGLPYVGHTGPCVPAAIISDSGRPVGFYTQGVDIFNVQRTVMFDLDTLSVIRATANIPGNSPMDPCFVGDVFMSTSGDVASYRNGEQFLLGLLDTPAYAVIPQDGSADFTSLDGVGALPVTSPGGTAVDPADPNGRMFWFARFPTFSGAAAHLIDIWESACSSGIGATSIVGCSVNSPPYQRLDTGWYVPPADGFTISPADFLGRSRFVVDGDNLYVAFMYYPSFVSSPPNTQPYWTQFAAAVLPIVRTTSDCPPTAAFKSKHKIHAAT